jgi:hypothetical protein
MGRIMNWFVAVYNCVIAAWAEQSPGKYVSFESMHTTSGNTFFHKVITKIDLWKY